jgi:hypothetical protein
VQIKNWKKFQHFKERRPPWIKLYRDILEDPMWFKLDPLSAKCLVMLWLVASENDGILPDLETISFRLRITPEKTENILTTLKHWIIFDDIKPISSRYQNDAPERERETYKPETETETETEEAGQNTFDVPLKRSRPARQKKVLSDDEWIQSLRSTEAYEHININSEYSKMLVWCQNKNKQPTRTRFINWLNRIEKPLKATGTVIPIGYASKGATGALERAAALRQKALEAKL